MLDAVRLMQFADIGQFAEPAFDHDPLGHAGHPLVAALVYIPAGQEMPHTCTDAAVDAAAYAPLVHAVHAVPPTPACTKPAGQPTQTAVLVSAANVPAGQLVQLVGPVVV